MASQIPRARFESIWKGKVCRYKSLVEEILFPTGSNCEECCGLDYHCGDYRPENTTMDDGPTKTWQEMGK